MEKLATGFQITIIGMAIVFIILILLNAAMNGMNWFLNKTEGAASASGEKDASAGSSTPKT
ncbi:MAG: OadG family protein [Desulfohalobiaceae bacterium]|nr:OadG family protein [Desulfohalobiaceae bacterium]